MLSLLRNSFVEKIIKSNLFFLYYSNFIIRTFNYFLLPLENDWEGFKNLNLKKKDIILDIGSHWGESYLIFRKYFKNSIYCYEPNNVSFKYLKKLSINDKKSKIFNFGIYHKNLKKNLFFPSYKNKELTLWGSDNLNNLKSRFKKHTFMNIDRVNFISKYCTFKKLSFIKNVALIKIDVEGAEYQVLLGINKKIIYNSKIIFVEYHQSNFLKIKKFLKKFKFQPFLFIKKNESFEKIDDNKKINKLKKLNIATNIFFIKDLNKLI